MNSLPLSLNDFRTIAEDSSIAIDQAFELKASTSGLPVIQKTYWNGHQMEMILEDQALESRRMIVEAFSDALEKVGCADFFPPADQVSAMTYGLTCRRMKQVLDRIDRATVKAVVVDDLPSELEPIINDDDPVIAEPVENSPLLYNEILGEYYKLSNG